MFDTPRSFRLAAAAAMSILVLTTGCANDTSGPHAPVAGKLAIAPDFGVLQTDIVDVARGRFVLTRIPSGTVAADTVIDIPPDADSVSLGILVPVLTPGETFNLVIRLVDTAGDTVFSGGPVEVSPTTSGAPVPVDIPFDYVGTGADAAGIQILSADTSSFTGESILLTAVALDSSEAPIPGTPIGWESLDTARVRITADAQDRGVAVGGNQRGVARIVAALVTGQMDTVLIANQPRPTAIVAESGSGQSARADSTLPSPLVARVTAADGLGVRGLWVRFAVTSGGGVISSDSVQTDTAGRAPATWTLARSFQPHVVTATTARLAAASAVFNATLVFEPAATLEIVAGDGQTAAAGTPVSIAPRVRVLDAAGLPVPGVTVTFSVTSGAGVVAGGTPVTDTLGLAAVASWTLSDVPGRNALQAAVGALTATFTATGVVGPAARLAFTVEPSTVARDAIIAPPVVVTAYDAVGNLAAGFGGDVQVALLANPGAATLSGSATRSATAGVATFDDLALGAAGTGYTLLATAAGLTPDTSAAFDVLTGATSWDAAADFSITANPNGRWSSGWTATLGSTFNLYPSASTGGNVVGWFDPAIVNLGTPSFAKNVSGVTQNGVAPGQVTLHPGCNAQEYSELRWTAPGSGTYLANARFLAGDLGNTNAAVLVNGGTPVFTAASTGGNPSYSSFLTLAPGDRLQFTVGTGGDGCTYDNTPIVVTVLATSAVTLTANSATAQSGPVGSPVSDPPSVVVRDGDGNPLAGVSVVFQVTAGGGSLTGATQQTGTNGVATVGSWTLGGASGLNTVTASLPGAAPVTFDATGTAQVRQIRWINPDGGAWETAANWDLGRVPAADDSVIIDVAGSYAVTLATSTSVANLRLGGNGSTPTLRIAPIAVASLTVADGLVNGGVIELTDQGYPNPVASLTVTGGTLLNTGTIVTGALWGGTRAVTAAITNLGLISTSGADLTIANAGRTFATDAGALILDPGRALRVNGGTFTVGGETQILGSGTIALTGGTAMELTSDFLLPVGRTWGLDLAGATGAVAISGTGTLIVADTLDIGSDAVNAPLDIRGVVSTGYDAVINGAVTMTASGVLRLAPIAAATLTVAGSLVNLGTIELGDAGFPNPVATLAVGSGTLVNLGTLRTTAVWGGTRIINASLEHRGLISLGTPLTITGQLIVPSDAGDVGVEGNGATLTVAGLDVSWLYFANTPLISTGGTIARFDNVRFDNMATNAVQLTVNHPGAATPFTFTSVWFRTTPTTGRYIRANDTDPGDGIPLTIDLAGATPPDGSAFEEELNGAIVNWTIQAGVNAWVGGSGNWTDVTRWSLGRVPIPGDTVRIEQAGDYSVRLNTSATVAKLRIGGVNDIVVLDATSWGLTITDQGPDPGLEILPLGRIVLSESALLAERLANQGSITAGGSLIQSSAFTNLGTLDVQWGDVVLSHPTAYDLQTSGTVLVEDGATLTLSANGGLTYLGGTITGGAASTGVIRLLPNVPLVLGADLTYNNLIVESIDGSVMPQAAQQLTVGQFAQFRAVGTGVTEILAPVAVDGIVDIRNGTLELGATAALNATGMLRGVGVLDATATTGTGALVGSINPGDQPSALPGILTWVGDFAPDPGAVLNIDLGGPGAGSQHDRLDVQGATELDGTLRVTLRDGFVPSAGDRFPVMTFSAALYGFATLAFPTVAGLVFDTTTVIDPTSADTLYVVVQSAPPQLIAFAGDSSGGLSTGVFRVYGDGTGLGRLVSTTFTGTNYFYPRWAPDRSRLGFAVTSAVAGIDLLTVVSADGAETATVVSDLTTRLPRWSPDGVHLAYACGEGSSVPFNQWHVCVITDATGSVSSLAGRGNGSGKVMVSWFDPVYRLNGVPAFAWNPTNPDQIAFVRDSAGAVNSSRIYVSTYTAGSWVRTELSPEVMDLGAGPLTIEGNWLDFSPDGQRIIFTATAPQDPVAHIYAINVNGTGLTQLSSGTGWDYDAWFSPDGSEILYNRDLSCSLDAWVMNGDGSNQHQVTAESVCDFQTWLLGNDWSPDGQAIVLTGFDTSGNLLIYKVPRTTTAQTYLVDRVLVGRGVDAGGFVRDIQPSWRP